MDKTPHSIFSAFVKRVFDICFSIVALLLFSPLFLIVALMIRRHIFFVQPRLGKDGQVFNCYKFRTMYLEADEHLQRILSSDDHLRSEWSQKQKLEEDPRVFPFGHFLRRTSLDELPQFFNVLKGDLSVVGPRPYMVSQYDELGPHAQKILSIRPGITGLWQTSGRSKTTFQQRINLDAKYVDKHSFWYDLTLILKTIPAIFPSNNAF